MAERNRSKLTRTAERQWLCNSISYHSQRSHTPPAKKGEICQRASARRTVHGGDKWTFRFARNVRLSYSTRPVRTARLGTCSVRVLIVSSVPETRGSSRVDEKSLTAFAEVQYSIFIQVFIQYIHSLAFGHANARIELEFPR